MGRLLVTSDWHGMLTEAKELIKISKYDPAKDELIVLGDWVDRGPYPIHTLRYMMQLKEEGGNMVRAIPGNHEIFMLELLDELDNDEIDPTTLFDYGDRNGMKVTYEHLQSFSYADQLEMRKFISGLPYMIYAENLVFVHAGIDNTKDLFHQDKLGTIHIYGEEREKFLSSPIPGNGEYTVVFGHTATVWNNYKIWHDQTYKDKIGIDCGGVFGGNLAMLSFVMKAGKYIPDEEFYVKCERRWDK